MLTADDYGFHQGDVWYRGRYTGDADTTTVALRYGGGGAGLLQAWLDGTYLGQDVLASGVASPTTTGTATFTVPVELRGAGDHVLSVMVRNDGHNEDGGVNDAHKEGRGLISATFANAQSAPVDVDPAWKVQGNLGGEDLVDPARGIVNAGGLYGERHGWHLPGSRRLWLDVGSGARPAVGSGAAGDDVVPHRLRPRGARGGRRLARRHDRRPRHAAVGRPLPGAAVRQRLERRAVHRGRRAAAHVRGADRRAGPAGPQHPGDRGDERRRRGNGLEDVRLTDLGTVRGGVPVAGVDAPGWDRAVYGDPSVPSQVAVTGLTSDAGEVVHGGDTIHVDGTLTNVAGGTATAVVAALHAPAGWTVQPAESELGSLPPGGTADLHWTVSVPGDVATGHYALSASATYTQDGTSGRTGAVVPVTVRSAGDIYVSDLDFVSATNGYGPVERDQNVGGTALGDGGPIVLKGTTYPKGIGTNAVSSVVVDIPAGCTRLVGDVGVDDAAGAGRGSVVFTVHVDGVSRVVTPVMRAGAVPVHLDVDVTGAARLTLDVGDAGDGVGHDNGDWGGLQLTGCTG